MPGYHVGKRPHLRGDLEREGICRVRYRHLLEKDVGWRAATTMETGLILNALEMAIWSRGERLDGLLVIQTPAANTRQIQSPLDPGRFTRQTHKHLAA